MRFILVTLLSLFTLYTTALSANAQVSGKLTMYTNRSDLVDNGSFKRWAKEFNRRYPSVTVKVVRVEQYGENMNKRFDNRDYGDIALIPSYVPKNAYPLLFTPLNDIGIGENMYFADNWAYEGKHYAYSQGVSAPGLIYNKAVFRKLGIKKPPSTLSEFYAAAKIISESGIVAIALNIGASWPLNVWNSSVTLFAEQEDYTNSMLKDSSPFNKGKPFYESLSIASHIFHQGYSEPDYVLNQWQDSKGLFASKKIASFHLGSWAIPQFIHAGAKSKDVGFVPFPIDDTGKSKSLLNNDWGIAVSRFSKYKRAAKLWLKFLLTESDFADAAGFIPTDKTRKSGMPQLAQYMSYKPKVFLAKPQSNDFLRLSNKAGMDQRGGYIRNILISPDFDGAMYYWNTRWEQAISTSQERSVSAINSTPE